MVEYKKMLYFIVVLFMFVIKQYAIGLSEYSINISEVFPNPIGEESENEWVEVIMPYYMLKNNTIYFIISDLLKNTTLKKKVPELNISPEQDVIVVISRENKTNCSYLYYNGTIGNGLNNNGDVVKVYVLQEHNNTNETLYVAEFAYDHSEEGKSIVIVNGSIAYKGPTPCYVEKINTTNETNENNESGNNSGNNNSSFEENSAAKNTGCSLDIEVEQQIYEIGDVVFFKIVTNVTPFTYWIEDVNGEVVKTKIKSSSDSEKRFTIKQPYVGLIIKAKNKCNESEEAIIVKQNKAATSIKELKVRKTSLEFSFETSNSLIVELECENETIYRNSLQISGKTSQQIFLKDVCGSCKISLESSSYSEIREFNIPCRSINIYALYINANSINVVSDRKLALKKYNKVFLPSIEIKKDKITNRIEGYFLGEKYYICNVEDLGQCIKLEIKGFEKKKKVNNSIITNNSEDLSDYENKITGSSVAYSGKISTIILLSAVSVILWLIKKNKK